MNYRLFISLPLIEYYMHSYYDIKNMSQVYYLFYNVNILYYIIVKVIRMH